MKNPPPSSTSLSEQREGFQVSSPTIVPSWLTTSNSERLPQPDSRNKPYYRCREKFPSSEASAYDTAKSDFPAEFEVPDRRSRTCLSQGIQNKKEKEKEKEKKDFAHVSHAQRRLEVPVGDITVFCHFLKHASWLTRRAIAKTPVD